MMSPPGEKTACRLRRAALLLMTVMVAACSGIQVNQDYDPVTDFSRYHTFAWAPEPAQKSGNALIDSPLMDRRIRTAIETTLASRGFAAAADNRPDFLVTYQLVVRNQVEVTPAGPAFGWGAFPYGYWGYPYPFWGGIDYSGYVDYYQEGTLIIDFTDFETQKLFWRGTGSRRVSRQSTPEKTTAEVNRIVAEILAQYPPPAGS
ncbi:MAG: DUF4136 domain-containing protein [Desulfobacterales bacterium]